MILSITLLALFGFAAADVSHLAKQYLPPNGASVQDQHMQHMQHATTTTIQKQELQELPEQIEYINPSEATVHSNNNAGEMEQQQQMMMAMMLQMPETKYLAPATAQQQQPTRQLQLKDLMPAEFLASSSSAQETMPQMQQRIPAMMNYLPPTAMPMQMEVQQPNYQQYQEQLQQGQQQGQDGPQQMEMLEAIRMAIDAVEQQSPQMTQAIMMEPEPEPAHILAADGYHYKNGDNQRRFRFRH